MTGIVATLSASRAHLTTDGLFAGPQLPIWAQGQLEDAKRRYGHLALPDIVRDGGGRKLLVFSEARMAMAMTGNAAISCCVGAAASEIDDIGALAEALPEIWRAIPAAGRDAKAILIAVGWSESSGRVVGYTASAEDGMIARPMEDGTCWSPDPYEDAPAAADIRGLLNGGDVDALHLAVIDAQAWGARQGRYGRVAIGDGITTAAVDKDGITLKRIGHIANPAAEIGKTTVGVFSSLGGRPSEAELLRSIGL